MTSQLTRQQIAIVKPIHEYQAGLKNSPDSEFPKRIEDLREDLFRKAQSPSEIAVAALALSREAIQRVLGMGLYDVQLLDANALIQKHVAEMATGEGKTISAAPAAVFGGIMSGGTHVATPNNYLAKRDCEQLSPVFEFLGLNTGLLDMDENIDKNDAYACDITYGPGYELSLIHI